MNKLKFWGIRGSYPQCSKDHIKYGGNTTCISMEIAGKLLIFDAGTGIIQLGKEMEDKYDEFHIFITHTHSDHIQGLNFFKPIYNKSKNVYVYGIGQNGKKLSEIIRTHFNPDYFPAHFCKLPGLKKVTEFDEYVELGKSVRVEGIRLDIHPLHGITVYKVNSRVVFATDVEVGGEIKEEERKKFIEFVRNTEILLHDGTYREENYKGHIGWGHSTVEDAVILAEEAKAEKLYIIHYSPDDTDKILDEKYEYYREKTANIYMPKEGEWIEILEE